MPDWDVKLYPAHFVDDSDEPYWYCDLCGFWVEEDKDELRRLGAGASRATSGQIDMAVHLEEEHGLENLYFEEGQAYAYLTEEEYEKLKREKKI